MEQQHFTHEEATAFFARLFGGEHHLPGQVKQCGHGFEINSNRDMSTFDGSQLTSFVLQCHDECVRGSIENGGPGRIKLRIWKRQGRETNPLPESPQPSPWIAVSDRLPPYNQNVLAISKQGRINITCVDMSGKMDAFELEVYRTDKWAFWMPLPAPPPNPSTD